MSTEPLDQLRDSPPASTADRSLTPDPDDPGVFWFQYKSAVGGLAAFVAVAVLSASAWAGPTLERLALPSPLLAYMAFVLVWLFIQSRVEDSAALASLRRAVFVVATFVVVAFAVQRGAGGTILLFAAIAVSVILFGFHVTPASKTDDGSRSGDRPEAA
jgi:hypothetical protein